MISVCVAVVERFSNSLTDDIRKNPKLIEDEFRKFCKSTKTKENRFVSIAFSWWFFLRSLRELAWTLWKGLADPKYATIHLACNLENFYFIRQISVTSIDFFLKFQCYYLGGLDESATGILGELSKPLSWNMPADKVCEKLKKKDAQICDLRYG